MRIVVLSTLTGLCFAISAACGGDVSNINGPGSDGGDTTDAGGGGDGNMDMPDTAMVPDTAPPPNYPAFKIDPPQVITGGGPVMATPKIVPVFFSNDDAGTVATVVSFLGKLPGSSYWKAPTTEYGVGDISIADAVMLAQSAPGTLSDGQIQSWLATSIGNGTLPMPDSQTIYALFYPSGTTITQGQGGGQSCQSFGGYHNEGSYGGKPVAYAVMPRCASFGQLKGIDAITGTTSHELIEAATDPYPQNNPAYVQVDTDHIVWEFALGGGEVGDMCAQFPDAFYPDTTIGHYVQRTWSNKAALGAHDPCVPAAAGAYFNTFPVLPDTITLGGGGQSFSTKGVHIPLGMSKTIPLELFSDAPTNSDWAVSAIDGAQLQGQAPQLSFSFDKKLGQNGDTIMMTITVNKASQFGAEAFVIESTLLGKVHLWVGLVGN